VRTVPGPRPETTERSGGAAFFDLDRTLLLGASGPILGEQLRRVGLIRGDASPVESAAFRFFDLVGETLPSMFLARQGARAAAGWPVDLVREAAEHAAAPLAERVLPYAEQMIAEHRAAGRKVVLATTTPRDLLEPFVELVGFDDVIATVYGRRGDRYDGSIDGEFVWGKGKSRSVAEWAGRHGVDLDVSFAYSDSYYDVPLLSIVGHPRAVNPDPRMLVIATLRRWPVVHFDLPAGIPKFVGVEPQQVLQFLARPQAFPGVRFRLDGVEQIPRHGPGVLVANHRSYFDVLAVGFLLARRGRPVRFLGKKEVFDAPVIGDLATALGGIRVDRGTGSEEPLRLAREALAAGELVALMPQGTIPRGPAFFDPVLRGRWGAAKLASAAGAPVVPIGLWGTEAVWPRSSKVPNLTNVWDPPQVQIRAGEPFHVDGDDLDADTERIMRAISELLPAEAHLPRIPTREELASTYPDGRVPEDVVGAGQHEATRRPGTD
jgi:putative phosphoserine phosphatase/1-acylglycerol-3-phosphate O-acyltransferase